MIWSKIIKKYNIPSKSQKDVWRHLILLDNGIIICDCPARKICWHIKAIKEKIIKDYAQLLWTTTTKSIPKK